MHDRAAVAQALRGVDEFEDDDVMSTFAAVAQHSPHPLPAHAMNVDTSMVRLGLSSVKVVLMLCLFSVAALFVYFAYVEPEPTCGSAASISDEFRSRTIDVVYTWVDGSDPEWRRRRDRARGHVKDVAAGNGATRFADNGELEYSVKATRHYMKGVLGRIFIVTDGQRPKWWHPEKDVDVIIIDRHKVESYNSNVIELFLHEAADDLSDWFLYFNDDVFLNGPVTHDTFFSADGRPRFFSDGWGFPVQLASVATLGLEVTVAARLHTDRYMRQRYARSRRARHHLMAHAPILLNRAVLRRLHADNRTEITRAQTHMFRQKDDLVLVAYMYHNYMLDHGLADIGKPPGGKRCAYVALTDSDTVNRASLERLQKADDVLIFCINDNRSFNFDGTQKTVHRFLRQLRVA